MEEVFEPLTQDGRRGSRHQGQGGPLTHADISQLGRAQLDVPGEPQVMTAEKLVGGGVLQPKERP